MVLTWDSQRSLVAWVNLADSAARLPLEKHVWRCNSRDGESVLATCLPNTDTDVRLDISIHTQYYHAVLSETNNHDLGIRLPITSIPGADVTATAGILSPTNTLPTLAPKN